MTNTTSIRGDVDLDYAEAWKPSPGETIIGTVVTITERDGGFGPYPVLEIRLDDGTRKAIHCFHTVLSSELAKQQPKPGGTLGVKYLGRRGVNSYHSYRVKIDRGDAPAISWGRYRADDAGPVAPDITMHTPTAATEGDDGDDLPF